MPRGIPKNPHGRRDRMLPEDESARVQAIVPKIALERFLLKYPRPGALRLLVNAAMRAAIERPDLCPWLRTSYGRHASGLARFRDHAKIEHPMRDIRAQDFVLEPVPEGGEDDAAPRDA